MTLYAERARDKTNHFAYDFACENVAHGYDIVTTL